MQLQWQPERPGKTPAQAGPMQPARAQSLWQQREHRKQQLRQGQGQRRQHPRQEQQQQVQHALKPQCLGCQRELQQPLSQHWREGWRLTQWLRQRR